MPTTDTTEARLATLIVRHLTWSDGLPAPEETTPTAGKWAAGKWGRADFC